MNYRPVAYAYYNREQKEKGKALVQIHIDFCSNASGVFPHCSQLLSEHLMPKSRSNNRLRSASSLPKTFAPCCRYLANTSSNLVVIFSRRPQVWRYLNHPLQASLLRSMPMRRWRQLGKPIFLMLMPILPTDGMGLHQLRRAVARARARASRINNCCCCYSNRCRHLRRHLRRARLTGRVPLPVSA